MHAGKNISNFTYNWSALSQAEKQDLVAMIYCFMITSAWVFVSWKEKMKCKILSPLREQNRTGREEGREHHYAIA